MHISQILIRLFPHTLLIGGAYWMMLNPHLLAGVDPSLIKAIPYIICLLGGGFAWFFQRANIAIAFVLAAGSLFALSTPLGNADQSRLIYIGVGILLPLNLWLLAIWVDRGVLSSSGLAKFSIIAAQFLVLYLMAYGENGQHVQGALAFLSFLPQMIKPYYPYAFPFFAACMISLTSLWFVVRTLSKQLPIDAGWAACLIGCAMGLWFFSSLHLFFIAGLISLVLSVIQDSYRMAFLDELTGLPGRRALVSDLKKLGNRYVIAMADIDHFKKFNDTYGHDVGDQVLQMVATNLSKITGGGRAYRYGGEEFTLVFPNKNSEETLSHLERVRSRVEKAEFTLRGKDRPKKKPKAKKASPKTTIVRVTASFGAAEKNKEHNDPMEVMKASDQALYRAKKAGRNQVSV